VGIHNAEAEREDWIGGRQQHAHAWPSKWGLQGWKLDDRRIRFQETAIFVC
jgi:hypothetical protein